MIPGTELLFPGLGEEGSGLGDNGWIKDGELRSLHTTSLMNSALLADGPDLILIGRIHTLDEVGTFREVDDSCYVLRQRQGLAGDGNWVAVGRGFGSSILDSGPEQQFTSYALMRVKKSFVKRYFCTNTPQPPYMIGPEVS